MYHVKDLTCTWTVVYFTNTPHHHSDVTHLSLHAQYQSGFSINYIHVGDHCTICRPWHPSQSQGQQTLQLHTGIALQRITGKQSRSCKNSSDRLAVWAPPPPRVGSFAWKTVRLWKNNVPPTQFLRQGLNGNTQDQCRTMQNNRGELYIYSHQWYAKT